MFIQNSYQEMSFVQIASFWYENFVVISITLTAEALHLFR